MPATSGRAAALRSSGTRVTRLNALTLKGRTLVEPKRKPGEETFQAGLKKEDRERGRVGQLETQVK
jgi:hypothetical protein